MSFKPHSGWCFLSYLDTVLIRVFVPTLECVAEFNKATEEWRWEQADRGGCLLSIPARQSERSELPSVALRAFQVRDLGHLRGGASRHLHQSKYFSAPTLTSIKISQQDHTLLLIIPHSVPCSAAQTVGSDKGAGSDGIMQLSVIVPTVVTVDAPLRWKPSFMSDYNR